MDTEGSDGEVGVEAGRKGCVVIWEADGRVMVGVTKRARVRKKTEWRPANRVYGMRGRVGPLTVLMG